MATLDLGLVRGKDGISPTIDVVDIEGGHRITITDADGTKSFDVTPKIRKVYDRANQNSIELTVSNNGVSFYDSVHNSRLYFNANNGQVTVYDKDNNIINRLYGTGNKPTAKDVGALPSDGTAADASKLGGKAPSYYMADYGRGEVLWSGTWSENDVTVPGTDKYTVFQITFTGKYAPVLAVKAYGYIRGLGGYSSGTPTVITNHFNASYNGDVWTLIACNRMSHRQSEGSDGSWHSALTNETVVDIVGIC